jgi:hypothetical protein
VSGDKNQIAAALIFRAGKILITQRRADSYLGGLANWNWTIISFCPQIQSDSGN